MSAETFQFLNFTLRPSLRQLSRNGAPVVLGARAYDLLLHLVANAHRVVGRDELMQTVWGDAVVGDNNLNVQSNRLLKNGLLVLTMLTCLILELDGVVTNLLDREMYM